MRISRRAAARRGHIVLRLSGLLAAAALSASAATVHAQSTAGDDVDPLDDRPVEAPRRNATDGAHYDQFGRVPEGAKDDDLALPDPVLDRSWNPPPPGDRSAKPEQIAPDEQKLDPLAQEAEAEKKAADMERAAPGTPKPDPSAANPAPVPPSKDPNALPPLHDDDIRDLLDEDDDEPSPLEKEERQYEKETADPEEW